MVRRTLARSSRGRGSRHNQLKRERVRDDSVPEVYQEMLEEAEARDPGQFAPDRPIKRRRVGDMKAIPVESQPLDQGSVSGHAGNNDAQQVQTVYDTTTTDESDVEWEDVDIQHSAPTMLGTPASQAGGETLQITLDQEPEKRKRTAQRRKPVTAAERKVRLEVHKTHLLCLLGHVHLRNLWCNDEDLQAFLKRMLPKRILTLLIPEEDKPQYIRSTTFVDGLNQAGDIFSRRFRVTKPGMKRAHWADDQDQLKQRTEAIMSNAEVFLSKEDFRMQAKAMNGSRDFGAQLFCALLRSAAVEARLVCSLQPLPFSGTVKDMTPSKAKPGPIVISSDDHDTSTDERQKPADSPTPSRIRRIGRPEFAPARPPPTSPRPGPRPTPQESLYPVLWVEAFNEAVQKWVAIDPVVTKSLAKPSKFEPPASDPYNQMNYVVAFEDDASARDVTRRYAKAFNAKTRKLRVESTRNGEAWWDKALRAYEKPFLEDRDAAEVGELTSKSAAEPMPRNIQDFKDHPVYALERHIRRNEVISPRRVIGYVGLSKTTSKSDNLEPVYRRTDVHLVRSADKWYRLGRDVKLGEQPLKRVPASRGKTGMWSDDDDEPQETTLYAEFQTEVYQPPPVVQGRIPKNAYGNLDIYVPSMVPPGAVHIQRPEAVRAARILGIDYAEAVTGFDFKGRRGTAIFRGIIIALEYQEALEEVLRSLEDERRLAALEARSVEALRFWRLFLTKLRIAERVKSYAGEDEELAEELESELVENVEDAGGGFFPEPHQPTKSPPPQLPKGGNLATSTLSSGDTEASLPFAPQDDEALGGGFIPDEPVDDAPAAEPAVLVANANPSPHNNRTQTSSESRYRLVVVPHHKPSTEQQPQPSTPEPTAPAEPPGSSEKVPIAVDSSTNGDSKSVSVDPISRPVSPQAHAPVPDSDSEIEKGSLLSEDPEDEDAIPEWLMSD
ncbi:hypothetical protein NUU61_009885 [Penicillium alfredii]|uniref:DNA repair protein Rad4 n=1 Tax=Penicillium alfredii TaxID=1506179 RepID=A0A9W9EGY9_9EURO|nr:uncharacterized protein NUU61_009885 [Penicillium alfredii]KAJ5081621.1 hypothetical protein NUU61_009885 [Penicillium alfredii]